MADISKIKTLDGTTYDLKDKNARTAISERSCMNLLDNWYFIGGGSQLGYGVFPINQKGQTVYNIVGDSIDRLRKANARGNVHVTSNGLKFSNSDNGYAYLNFYGVDVPDNVLATYTVLTDIGIFTISTAASPVTLPSGILIYLTEKRLSVRLPETLNINDSELFIAAKVEIGEGQTLAHYENGAWVLNELPNFSNRLAICQSYAFNSGFSLQELIAVSITTNAIDFFIPLPTTPAKAPTVDSINALLTSGAIIIKNYAGASQTGFSCTLASVSSNGLLLRFSKTSHNLNNAFLEITANTVFNFN